jgi:hypothetical protein
MVTLPKNYSGAAPVAPLENIFGVTSFELG